LATLHFEAYPLHRNLFALDAREIEGEKFPNWQQNANYSARVNVILQLDSYNVSDAERGLAQIILIQETFAQVNIYQTWHAEGISFEESQAQWAEFEISLEKYALELVYKLNNARSKTMLPSLYTGQWYINYGLNEKHIEVREP